MVGTESELVEFLEVGVVTTSAASAPEVIRQEILHEIVVVINARKLGIHGRNGFFCLLVRLVESFRRSGSVLVDIKQAVLLPAGAE